MFHCIINRFSLPGLSQYPAPVSFLLVLLYTFLHTRAQLLSAALQPLKLPRLKNIPMHALKPHLFIHTPTRIVTLHKYVHVGAHRIDTRPT